jgi:hypothetical protein
VAARCDSEAANVLGLNMVHELVTGKRTVEGARHTSEQSTVAYNVGREAPYAERLLFAVPEGGTEDLDHSHLAGRCCSRRWASSRTRSPLEAGRPPTVERPADRGDAQDGSFDAAGWRSAIQQPPGSDWFLASNSASRSGLTQEN